MSAQPTLSTASEQAQKYGYPSWSIMTSTPNGTEGTGKFFFEMWQNSVSSDDLFEIDTNVTKEDETNNNLIYEKFKSDSDELIKSPGKNGFKNKPIKIKKLRNKCQIINYLINRL